MRYAGAILATAVAATMLGTSAQASPQKEWAGEPFPQRPHAISVVNSLSTSGAATWAVGGLYTPVPTPTRDATQVFRRENGRWQQVQAPNIGDLVSSASTSPRDAWAVSAVTMSHDGGSIHWDGKAWTRVPVQVPGATRISPSDLVGAGSGAWMVGTAYVDGEHPKTIAFTKRWNGTGWQDVPLPPAAASWTMTALSGSAPEDLWAIGSPEGDAPQLGVLHWDGTAWKQVPVPNLGQQGITPIDVSAVARDDVWISAAEKGNHSPVLLHWDGSSWKRVDAPTKRFGEFVQAEGTLWNFGQKVLRYDGTSWHTVATPPQGVPDTGGALPDGRLAAVGTTDAIAYQPWVALHSG